MDDVTPSATLIPAQPVTTVTNPAAPFPPADPLPAFVPPAVTDPVSKLDFLPVDDRAGDIPTLADHGLDRTLRDERRLSDNRHSITLLRRRHSAPARVSPEWPSDPAGEAP